MVANCMLYRTNALSILIGFCGRTCTLHCHAAYLCRAVWSPRVVAAPCSATTRPLQVPYDGGSMRRKKRRMCHGTEGRLVPFRVRKHCLQKCTVNHTDQRCTRPAALAMATRQSLFSDLQSPWQIMPYGRRY